MGLEHLGFMSHVFLVDARLIVRVLREVSGQRIAHPLLLHKPRKVQRTLPCVWVATERKKKVGISNATPIMQVMSLAGATMDSSDFAMPPYSQQTCHHTK